MPDKRLEKILETFKRSIVPLNNKKLLFEEKIFT